MFIRIFIFLTATRVLERFRGRGLFLWVNSFLASCYDLNLLGSGWLVWQKKIKKDNGAYHQGTRCIGCRRQLSESAGSLSNCIRNETHLFLSIQNLGGEHDFHKTLLLSGGS